MTLDKMTVKSDIGQNDSGKMTLDKMTVEK